MKPFTAIASLAAVMGTLLSPAAPGLAHHGYSRFDGSKPMYFEGEIRSVYWGQPHVEFVLRSTGSRPPHDLSAREIPEGGAVPAGLRSGPTGDWEILASTIGRLERRGARQSDFRPGARIQVVAYPSCDEPNHARAELLSLEDGRLYWIRDAQAQTACEASLQ
ncbi:DUF6152 family protein [Mesorhizobium sp. RMAD-H1]|uniref:DUF6152 family protein n=1 Tax=Mesorhizobium sp. RMAD-H1 TaxID=2587065 RepID=UPI001617BC3D|nr:DUF6152 family protein [Mesorhizobium sp. RMAD-H1]MBB2974268.1 hypothetical protein [Mesorhizobium sp. RMAD-H1]